MVCSTTSQAVEQLRAAVPRLTVTQGSQHGHFVLITAAQGGSLVIDVREESVDISGYGVPTPPVDRMLDVLLGRDETRYARADGTRGPSLADVDTSGLTAPGAYIRIGFPSKRAPAVAVLVHEVHVHRFGVVDVQLRQLHLAEATAVLLALAAEATSAVVQSPEPPQADTAQARDGATDPLPAVPAAEEVPDPWTAALEAAGRAYVQAIADLLRARTSLPLPVIPDTADHYSVLTLQVETPVAGGTVRIDVDDRVQCCTLSLDRVPLGPAAALYRAAWGEEDHGHFDGASTLDGARPGDEFEHEDDNDDAGRRTLDPLRVEVLDDSLARVHLPDLQLGDVVAALRCLTP